MPLIGSYKHHCGFKSHLDDGVWSPQGASIELIIPPHFWQTWWFVTAVLLLGGVGIAFTARQLEKTQAQRRLERQQQAHLVELERARLARDFHDDIGASSFAIPVR